VTGLIARFAPRTITAQIACLVIAAVVLGVGLASGVLLYLFYSGQAGSRSDIAAVVRAARIAAVVREVRAAETPADRDRALKTARRRGAEVVKTPVAGIGAALAGASRNAAFVQAVKTALDAEWGIAPLPAALGAGETDAIAVGVDDDEALVFRISPPRVPLHNFLIVQTTFALAIIVVIILFLSLYAVRWVTSPLSSIAAAARSFGHAASAEEDRTLPADGPREIAQVAEALNDMRKRVRSLVDERTQMLVAISHDLRTPLTRLRLRAERLADGAVRDGMLVDIETVNDMLGETLTYLREGGGTEPVHLVDLPSLLQTICAQFSDVGHDVSYQGPDRFAFACRAHALNRAVTNVVDNATKHGGVVTVALRALDDARAEIDVSDDGPGIPASLREKMFEPFVKGDGARPAAGRAGFGLGLSIARDIVRRQGGEVELLGRAPKGLTVRVSLAGQPGAQPWSLAVAAD
jgi:signal transduction histidine kinase